tara:strand:+ start:2748 stop:2936 length:189 start_codon:yes stop_codon:yes gene_type:complete
LPALGNVAVKAKPTATAASTAFPPLDRISAPISEAINSETRPYPYRILLDERGVSTQGILAT